MPVEVHEVTVFETEFIKFMHTNYPQIGQDIKAKKEMTGETEAALVKAVAEFTREYGASHQLIKEEE
jgi:F-type H+-transporting ATPase subunit alpha